MNNFTFYNPVRVHFGKNQVTNLKEELKDYEKYYIVAKGFGFLNCDVDPDSQPNLEDVLYIIYDSINKL